TRFSRDWSSDVCSSDLGLPCSAVLRRALPGPGCPSVPCRGLPFLAAPCRALPRPTVPCRSVPFPAAASLVLALGPPAGQTPAPGVGKSAIAAGKDPLAEQRSYGIGLPGAGTQFHLLPLITRPESPASTALPVSAPNTPRRRVYGRVLGSITYRLKREQPRRTAGKWVTIRP